MASLQFTDIKGVRKSLGKSQTEFAGLIGRSVRALQSYEQGWRDVPEHVQRTAALLVYLHGRKTPSDVKPCWEIRRCKPKERETCPVYELRAGYLCWLLSSQCSAGSKKTGHIACGDCAVMKARLQPPPALPTA